MSLVVLLGGISRSWGSPGDVLTIDVPILGNEVPKSRDLPTGDASVSSQTGALTYSFAITVPPGRLVEPSLALAYSSSAAVHGSPAGAGWSLFLPEIRNDPADSALATQSSSFVQHYVSSLAGGNRLVEVDEPAAADVLQTYRAQFDGSYARYERLGPGRWRVRTTDGLTHFFGEADHMPDAATGVNDPTWAPLSRTVDPFGNTVHYYWFQVKNAGGAGDVVEHVLDRIEYTANPAAGIESHAQVDFQYSTPQACGTGTLGELPVGARFEPRGGEIRWVGSRRLDAVVTRVRDGAGWRDVRTLTLGYDEDADACSGVLHGPLRLLTSIQESALSPDGVTVTAMPPVTFQYGPLIPNRSVPRPFARGFALAASPTFIDSLSGGYREGTAGSWPQLEVMLLDLDADGRLDRLFAANDAASNDECAFVWQHNEGDGFGSAVTPIRLPTFHWGEGAFDPQADCSLAGQRSRFENTQACLEGDHYLSYRFVDINGDQLPELVAGLQYDPACLDLDPFNQPSPIPPEWGWDPDRVCPQTIATSGGDGWCPDLAPGALRSAEVCEPHAGCHLDLDAVDSIVRSAPRTPCGDLMAAQATADSQVAPPPGTEAFPRRHLDQCGEYLWLIYWNRGGAVIDTAPTPIWSPIPLESNGGDTALGSRTHGFSSNYHAIIDIDGDGLVDVLTRVAAIDNSAFLVYRGDGNGHFLPKADGQPYLFAAPPGATTGNSSWTWTTTGGTSGYGLVAGSAGVMDVSGDGLPDLFLRSDEGDGQVHSYLNLGNRFQYSPTDWQNPIWRWLLTWSATQNAESFDFGTSISSGNRAGWIFPLDWDGDGHLDLYERGDNIPPTMFNDGDADDFALLYVGDGGGMISSSVELLGENRDNARQYLDAGSGDFRVLRDFVDLDGDGSGDVVAYDAPNDQFVYQIDTAVSAGTPPRLLNRIDNGGGGVTEVRYRASSDTSIDIPGTDDAQGMPTHTWVVDAITRTDNADALGTTGTITGTTTYRYGRPVYNQERHPAEEDGGRYGFRGFEKVQVISPLGAVTESVYDYTLDWSGRLVETTVYASGNDLDIDRPTSIEQTSWQAFTLFCPANYQAELDPDFYYVCTFPPNVPLPVPAMSFQPVDRKSFTCANGQSKADCLALAPRRVETTTWLGQVAADDDPDTGTYLVYRQRIVWKKRGDAIQDGDRRFFYTHRLFSGADFYRLRRSSEHVFERVDGVDVERATRVHFWGLDPSGHDGAFETATRDHLESAATATTQMRNDLGLGLVTSRRKPEQYQQNLELWTNVSYDAAFPVQPAATTNELGHVVSTVYDLGTGALLDQHGPNSVPCGTGCVESEGTRTEIDGFGRPLKVFAMTEDPDGTYREILIQRFTYRDDVLPRRVTEERRIDWDGPDFTKSYTEFDGFGRVQERKEFRFEAGTIDPIERFRYDAQGNVDRVQVRDPSLDTSASVAYLYDFDALDRPIQVDRPNGSCVVWSYDGLATTRREVATNCPTGGMTADPEAETTTTSDVFGRLVQVDESIDDTNVATTLYGWDANDNLHRVESPDGIVTVLDHDWMSRRTSITRGERIWAYAYDLNSNLIGERAPVPGNDPLLFDAYTTSIGYDALDRPTSRLIGSRQIDPADLDDLGATTISFDYDQGTNGLGRLTSVSNPIWTRTYQYDARGNAVEDSLTFDLEPALGVAIQDTRTLTRTFNPLGRAVDEYHGDGTTLSGPTHTTTTYNQRGLPATLIWQQMPSVTLATANWNGAGFLTSLGAAPVTQTWTYDNLGRVTGTSAVSTEPGQPTISESWTYYATDDPHTLATARTGLATRNFTFSFDDRHQLENAFDDAGYSADFGFTAGGRLWTANVMSTGAPLAPPRDVTYDYPDPLDADYDLLDPEAVKALVPTSGSFSMQYGYDLSGNVTSRTEGAGQPDFTFLYDGEDQQRIATPQNGDHELYYYDHAGNRILAVTRQPGGTVTKAHLWFGSLEVEYDGSNNVTQTLAHLSLDRPVARIENRASAKRVVHDQLGHFLGAFTENGQALDVTFVYGPFGEILAQSGADPADYTQRFNGKEQDALTDLSYYGVRYFDPVSVTWTQADPVYRFAPDLALDQPRRSNLYEFSLQNPLRYMDIDGKDPQRSGQGVRVLVLYGKEQGGIPLQSEKQRTQFRHAASNTYSKRYAKEGKPASVVLKKVGNASDVRNALKGSKSNVVVYLGHAEQNSARLRPSGPADEAAVTPQSFSGSLNGASSKPQTVEVHACFTDENGFGEQLAGLQPGIQVTVYHGNLAVKEQCERGGQSATDCRLQYVEGKRVIVDSKKGEQGTHEKQ